MEMSFSKRGHDVHNGKLVEKHTCLVCFFECDTLDELIAHEDLVHPELAGNESEDLDTDVENEEVDEDDNPLSTAR